MPRHDLAVPRHLAEEMRPPAHHVLAEQVLDECGDAGVGDQVPDAAVFHVGMLHRVTAATLRQHPADDGVDKGARLGDLLFRENTRTPLTYPSRLKCAICAGVRTLGFCTGAGMKREVPVHVGQLVLRRICLELRRSAHWDFPSARIWFLAGNPLRLPTLNH